MTSPNAQFPYSTIGSPSIPARLYSEQVAKILGFQEHDIPILVAARLLKPLGNPAPNAPKYFAAIQILDVAQKSEWLDKASKAISKYWREKNSRKKSAHLLASQG